MNTMPGLIHISIFGQINNRKYTKFTSKINWNPNSSKKVWMISLVITSKTIHLLLMLTSSSLIILRGLRCQSSFVRCFRFGSSLGIRMLIQTPKKMKVIPKRTYNQSWLVFLPGYRSNPKLISQELLWIRSICCSGQWPKRVNWT